jgi:hypothetical protein
MRTDHDWASAQRVPPVYIGVLVKFWRAVELKLRGISQLKGNFPQGGRSTEFHHHAALHKRKVSFTGLHDYQD